MLKSVVTLFSLVCLSQITFGQVNTLDTNELIKKTEISMAPVELEPALIEITSARLFPSRQQLEIQDDLLQNFLKLGGDQKAFDQITCFYNKYSNATFSDVRGENSVSSNELRIKNKRYITINDLTKPTSQARLFVLDLKTNEVKAYFTSHGIGVRGGQVTLFQLEKLTEEKKKSIEHPVLISSRPGSNASPRGAFILGKTYEGSFGYSLKIHGLQKGINETTYARAVVMHGLGGMNPQMVSSSSDETEIAEQLVAPGNLAVSQGCTMLEPNRAREIIDAVQGQSLYYNYTDAEKKEVANYCADKNLLLQKR